MDGFLTSDGSTLAQAIDAASVIAHCATDQIAYCVVPEVRLGVLRIIATPIDFDSGPPQIYSDELESPWQSQRGQIERRLLKAGNSTARTPASIADLLELPAAQPIALDKARTIFGDISATDGAVAHFGDIIVRGNLGPTACVRARGRVLIFGNVERAANVFAQGQIVVTGGVLGDIRSTRGNVQCGFAQYCSIDCGADLTIRGDASQCKLAARNSINVGGAIEGGTAYAETDVSALVIGSSDGAATTRIQVARKLRQRRMSAVVWRRWESADSDWSAAFYAQNLRRLVDADRATGPVGAITAYREFCSPTLLRLGGESRTIEERAEAGTFWVDDESGSVMEKHNG